jgi:PKD repeat protein
MFSQTLQPVALFNAPNNICPGTCTNFTNTSLNATSYNWTFTGANPSVSTDVNPTGICYNTPGQYDVMLIASNATGSDTLLLQNFINVYPYPPPQGITMGGDTLYANQGAVSYQWYYNGVLIPGATNYFFVVTDGGNYNVVCTDANGCEVEAAIFDVPAGLPQQEISSIRIYPNPVSEQIFIASDEMIAGDLLVYNSLGQQIIKSRVSSFALTVDLRKYAPGIYLIELPLAYRKYYKKFLKH